MKGYLKKYVSSDRFNGTIEEVEKVAFLKDTFTSQEVEDLKKYSSVALDYTDLFVDSSAYALESYANEAEYLCDLSQEADSYTRKIERITKLDYSIYQREILDNLNDAVAELPGNNSATAQMFVGQYYQDQLDERDEQIEHLSSAFNLHYELVVNDIKTGILPSELYSQISRMEIEARKLATKVYDVQIATKELSVPLRGLIDSLSRSNEELKEVANEIKANEKVIKNNILSDLAFILDGAIDRITNNKVAQGKPILKAGALCLVIGFGIGQLLG